jgi:transglycosylase-like protein with SLT domain/D-alanyl-D-alanine carboxypeptidase-like protein/putative Flp pilus-assembly TadE/G-like protein
MRRESGQALVLLIGAMAALVFGALILGSFGQALGARGHEQRAADLAAVSAAQTMRNNYPRLFIPPNDPGHLSQPAYLALARAAAVDGARRNGAKLDSAHVTFPDAISFAPVRVSVALTDEATVHVPGGGSARRLKVTARATAALTPAIGGDAYGSASGGGYTGPLAYRQGKGMRPDVAPAFDRMAAAAQKESGISLLIVSAYRSDAEQAKLFAAHPDPKWVAPAGQSLHRFGTELDLGPPSAYAWLAANAQRFGFIERYSWEPWHWGFRLNAGTTSVGFGDGAHLKTLPNFVPAALQGVISKAAQRWNVSGALLAAQLYAESNFNPFAQSGAGAQGIAQFTPGTAQTYGLTNPFDPAQAIDAQAHLMRDLLRRFASVPLALAAYNAGPAPVAACGCIPAIPETQAYVAKILGLLGGAGESPAVLTVRLVA